MVETCVVFMYLYNVRTKLILTDDKLSYRKHFGFRTVPYAGIAKLSWYRQRVEGAKSFIDIANIVTASQTLPALSVAYKPFRVQDVAILIDTIARHAPGVVFGENIIKLWQGIDPDRRARSTLGYISIEDTTFQSPGATPSNLPAQSPPPTQPNRRGF